MVKDNIVFFPATPPSAGITDRIDEIASLVEQVAHALDTEGQNVDVMALLGRLLSASVKLGEIGNLILQGSNKMEVQRQVKEIECMIKDTHRRLELARPRTDPPGNI